MIRGPTIAMPDDTTSVVLTLRDQPDAAVAALRMLAGQTHQALDVVVVTGGDNATTEAAGRTLAELALNSRIIVSTTNDDALFLSRSRNAGVAASRGAYVTFLEPGIHWKPDKLAAQVARLQSDGDATLCLVQGRWHDRAGQPEGLICRNMSTPDTEGWRALLWAETVPATCVMARRIDLGTHPFDTTLAFGAEQDLWIKLATNGHTAFITTPLVDCPRPTARTFDWHAALQAGHMMIDGHLADFADQLSPFERYRARARVLAEVGLLLAADPRQRSRATGLLARAALAGVMSPRQAWRALHPGSAGDPLPPAR